MSDSVFVDNANATLVFDVAGTGYQVDPATGNRMPIAGKVEIKCMVRQPQAKANQIDLAGADQTRLVLQGRAVEPMHFPAAIRVGARAKCTITDLFTGNEEVGVFEVTILNQSAFAVVTEVLGSYFEGVFRVDNAGEVLYA